MWNRIIDHLPLCRHLARRFGVREMDLIMSDVAYDAIRNALETFTEGGGRTESSWVGFCFVRRLIDYFKKKRVKTVAEIPETSYIQLSKLEDEELVQSILEGLDPYETLLFKLYFWKEFTYEEIGTVRHM